MIPTSPLCEQDKVGWKSLGIVIDGIFLSKFALACAQENMWNLFIINFQQCLLLVLRNKYFSRNIKKHDILYLKYRQRELERFLSG